jgi:hypothetical protein
MSRTEYHRHYWQQYRARKKRVTITLSPSEYRALKARAGRLRKPGEQLWLEAQAYREDRYLPPEVVAERIDGLLATMLRLYDLLSAVRQSPLGRTRVLPETLERLHQMRAGLDRFLSPVRR